MIILVNKVYFYNDGRFFILLFCNSLFIVKVFFVDEDDMFFIFERILNDDKLGFL